MSLDLRGQNSGQDEHDLSHMTSRFLPKGVDVDVRCGDVELSHLTLSCCPVKVFLNIEK